MKDSFSTSVIRCVVVKWYVHVDFGMMMIMMIFVAAVALKA